MDVDAFGLCLGRRVHRTIITIILILWMIFVFGFIAVLILNVPTIVNQVVQWRGVLISIQVVVGGLIVVALLTWLVGNEELGLRFAISGFLLSLVALQTVYFYLSQFAAITATLLQLLFLLILLAYRRWYLSERQVDVWS
jgi:chromate transport protein ChrA